MTALLLGYLGVGVIVCIAILVAHKISKDREFRIEIEPFEESQRRPFGRREAFLEKVVVPLFAAILAIIAWPLAIYWKVKDMSLARNTEMPAARQEFSVSRGDLLVHFTVEEIERREMVHDPFGAVPNLPFGHLNPAWEMFKASLLPGDEIWSFSALHTSEWGLKDRREGYVIVRGEDTWPYFLTGRRNDEPA